MNRDPQSFQENIRRTFIRFSIVPIAIIVSVALFLFVFSWSIFTTSYNKQGNRQVAGEITRILNIYYELLGDVSDVLEKDLAEKNETVSSDEIFSKLYDRTAEFSDIGNLIILSASHEALFTSKDYVPKFLTDENYANWGVWNKINKYKSQVSFVLYEKALYAVKGVYEKNSLRYAICYIVPGEVISNAAGSQSRFLIITDKNGFVYASNTKKLQDNYGQIIKEFDENNGFVKYNGTLFYAYKTVTDKGIVVYTISDIGKSVELILALIIIIAIIFIGISLITIRSTAGSSERYTKDIRKIEDAFEEVQNGNLDATLNIDSSTEFKIIGNDFNEMLKGLKEQIEKNNELAEHAAFSQVKQLESQFNPHFLFNTLDNIRFMAKIDAAAADKMIVSLSGLLRYSIREMKEEVTVREDLDNLQYYLNILQIRFNKRFAYVIDVYEDIMDFLIPKLLLQPLLENAIKYGFNGQEKLSVHIRGYQMQEKLIFVCEDDGAGIEENRLKEIQNNLQNEDNTSNHYGLYNIHRRIRLMYKGDYGLDIASAQGQGTTVRIIIPRH
ncbi:sensor histidine kinase [Butyrivibrio sp. YAB3001]|uniref:sensor histidine kinase n=1 Tax=Butyrivibrio sp. YAB3001 TaxID=1520812 RepID=UPI0008F676A1|nr:histidine kinase [Butyrivibrio sp. YAB3001]SFB75874.1 Sensor histidine kinase YesM [Butyrivibrio sp. YAB3001]